MGRVRYFDDGLANPVPPGASNGVGFERFGCDDNLLSGFVGRLGSIDYDSSPEFLKILVGLEVRAVDGEDREFIEAFPRVVLDQDNPVGGQVVAGQAGGRLQA